MVIKNQESNKSTKTHIKPHKAARPMEVINDKEGNSWLCDKDVDLEKDLKDQGCWRCGDLAFTASD